MTSNGQSQTLEELSRQWSNRATRSNPSLVLKVYSLYENQSASTDTFLNTLDATSILEKLLWPTLNEDASQQHILLLAVLIKYKHQTRTLNWKLFEESDGQFSLLFHRLLSLSLDTSLTAAIRTSIIEFISCMFQSLEQDIVRKECAPLVSIGIWEHLHSETLSEKQLSETPARRKAWKSAQKKLAAAQGEARLNIKIERAWLYNMSLDFASRVNIDITTRSQVVLCARFLELLIDLISQLPTRRYSIVLLKDLNLLTLLKQSILYNRQDCAIIRDLTTLLEQFLSFQIDDNGDTITTRKSAQRQHLIKLQRIALQHFPDSLKVLALSNLATLESPEELQQLLEALSDDELLKLCELLDIRTSYPTSAAVKAHRQFWLSVVLAEFAAVPSVHETVQKMSTLPTEQSLYSETLLTNEVPDNKEPLTIPKLSLQYLTLTDFLWRSFTLHQAEAFYEIRRDLEAITRKVKPQLSANGNVTFGGFSKMAMPIDKPAIIEVLPPQVGETVSAQVKAEVILDVSRLGDRVRSEWDSLKPRDTVFLLTISPLESQTTTNGSRHLPCAKEHSIRYVRTAEVVQLQDEKGKPLKEHDMAHGRTRRLLLNLDAYAFARDKANTPSGTLDVYKSINLIARRSGRENNFKPLLESIKTLSSTNIRLPSWLQGVFLGYDKPSAASYPALSNEIPKIDYLDTFLDWDHLQGSFEGKKVTFDGDHVPTPPYVLHFDSHSQTALENPKKRRHDQIEDTAANESLQVSSYQPQNTGPYPMDKAKGNQIRFTSRQVEALVTASHPGLSLIVGPPGTGKTDVATQLINVLYHNFPQERILLVAHSNQALNQLFQKIVALDIDPRHLLRLGHGQEDLNTEASFGKSGRVESFLEQRQGLLAEVTRLASSLMVEGAHGATCETADYFNNVHIRPAWTNFWSLAEDERVSAAVIRDAFPFHKYFSNAPVPDLFSPIATPEQCREIAHGCQHHLNKIFADLEAIRPFEILRSPRDQANHLLIKEARVIAMTATHAAIRRAEIAGLGFHYDTLIMEEAAQVTEVETFIPCTMQAADTETGELPIKRIVLVGDHLQNSPVIQNFGLRENANLEQSLFLRLIRLGVPHIMLDAQGRCRPGLARLFDWRYPGLKSLPHITSQPDFVRANAGFRFDHQFINVDDYQEAGEREPSPHFIQNLGEAEYAVALYQYMRLLGYPARSITILAAYAGQRALIRDVLEHRCKGNKLFGMPHLVTTIDKYQGEQNDYVILSLTRTKTVGYLRDVRRLTVALSRARLGLYILGRRALFEELPGLDIACQQGNARGNLEVVTGEMSPTQRATEDNVDSTEIHGVEHMGQFVYEMTQAKIKSLGGTITNDAHVEIEGEIVDVEFEDEADLDAELDPLHENV